MNTATKIPKVSASLEDYLEAIHMLDVTNTGVRVVDISQKLSVSKPSVAKAMKTLFDMGMIKQEKYSLIYLTSRGLREAQSILKRHNTIRDFLSTILSVNEAVAEDEACLIEHIISDDTISKMGRFLENFKQSAKLCD